MVVINYGKMRQTLVRKDPIASMAGPFLTSIEKPPHNALDRASITQNRGAVQVELVLV